MFKKPDISSGSALFKKQDIGGNTGVRGKHALGQAHNGVQIEILQQFFFQGGLDPFAKQKTIRQDHGSAACIGFEQVHDQGHEQISRFAGLVTGQKVFLNAIFFHAPKGRVGDNNIHPVFDSIVTKGTGQSIIMADAYRHINIVQHHVGYSQHVWQGLFFNTMDIFNQKLAVFSSGFLLF